MDSSVATQVSARGSEPVVPEPRGPLSSAVLSTLVRQPPGDPLPLHEVAQSDPYGEDLQLALYACYELHYRGFGGVDPGWEWDPELLRLRVAMESVFHEALRGDVAGGDSPDDLDCELDALLAEPREPRGVSQYLKRYGTREQLREYFAHRSAYQLKEADPQAWVIPRLEGPAKAALVAVEYDEFGGGRAERVHARLFADLMAEAGLDPTYGRYVDATPAVTLATVNLMSYLGLHRAQRAALVGHFAAAEITTAPAARRMVDAIDRLGAGPACRFFYSEHVEADAVHEQVLRRDVIGGLLDAEPALLGDVVFGIQATGLLDDRMERHLLDCWREGRTSLCERGW
ncbi:iron-containing redox enzyme family protein [Streptomyces flaveus]|uniref:iron-containing redox enzyme family protein n=1 Tax=Streptomyces flaveus TaxID=66370 RepID=UPI00332F1A5A